jgi:hypothetical protein
MKTDNEFGAQTFWNRPPQGRQRKPSLKYPDKLKPKVKQAKVSPPSRSPSRSPSPTASQSPSQSSKVTIVSPSRSAPKMPPMSKEEENDAKDEKSIVKLMKSNLPKFSNEVDWEMAVFELGLVLDRIWPHKDELDIVDHMTSPTYRRSFSGDMENREDRLIYFALTLSAKKNTIVSTMAKLGESVSSGAWIYALGNGLRNEFKESKDGILYNKDTIWSVKKNRFLLRTFRQY